MNLKLGKRLFIASCLSLWMLIFWANPSVEAAAYRYRDLGLLSAGPYAFAWAGGINRSGQVVGYSGTLCADGNYEPHAFLFAAGGPMRDLGTLAGGLAIADGYMSGVNAINSSGRMVGWSSAIITDGTYAQHAFLTTASGPMQDLGTLGGGTAVASGINNSGQVVGWSSTILPSGTPQHACLWTAPGTMQDLGAWGGDSWAYGINSSGQVVGAAATTGAGGTSVKHGFLWTAAGGLQDLGTLGGDNSSALAINDLNQIVGFANTAAGQQHAFLRPPGGNLQDLGTLGGDTSGANSINSSGQVVGWSLTIPGSPVQHAFLWTAAGGMRDLNNLVANPPAGAYLFEARAINDLGQIVGRTNNGRAFLLTPVNAVPPLTELLLN
ncbi:MAG: HAF repeat-containing protein [Desulfobaccales bacterium]